MLVEGRLQTTSYEKDGSKRYKTEVIATDLFLGGGGALAGTALGSAGLGHTQGREASAGPRSRALTAVGTDNDIPF